MMTMRGSTRRLTGLLAAPGRLGHHLRAALAESGAVDARTCLLGIGCEVRETMYGSPSGALLMMVAALEAEKL